MIKNSAGKLYVGITKNPNGRVAHHNNKRGAKFTKRGPDFRIVFIESYDSLAQARQREAQLKRWRRQKKEVLIGRYHKGLPTKI